MEYSILFPTFAFFQNVFHLPFGDKSIIRFKAANSVQCISLNELLSGIDGTMMFRYNSKDIFQALYVYLSEYHSGKRVSHKRVLELSYEDVKSAKNGLIVITPDFDNFTAKLIAADEYSKYMTETPILEGVANREYYGRSATSIENKSTIEYGTEQGLAALIYGEQGVSSLPIQDITGEYIDTDNEYMYYYSAEFVK